MVLAGDADGALAGAANSSAQVIRSASQIIGQDTDYTMISSFFLMVMKEEFHVRNGVVAFADCALTVEPDGSQLADIAATTADSFQRLLGLAPKVALLSFVTGDSANASVRKVAEAGEILAQLRPDLAVDAPVQFDAAFSPEVAAIKAPGSDVAGQANIFVFPDLSSANIGYKIAERIGRAKAIGPIMQGFAKPVNDLSRGCSEDDIYAMIALTAIQAQSA
jgi:phosphate acetyltransferase